jgi:hypothetical protein
MFGGTLKPGRIKGRDVDGHFVAIWFLCFLRAERAEPYMSLVFCRDPLPPILYLAEGGQGNRIKNQPRIVSVHLFRDKGYEKIPSRDRWQPIHGGEL